MWGWGCGVTTQACIGLANTNYPLLPTLSTQHLPISTSLTCGTSM